MTTVLDKVGVSQALPKEHEKKEEAKSLRELPSREQQCVCVGVRASVTPGTVSDTTGEGQRNTIFTRCSGTAFPSPSKFL